MWRHIANLTFRRSIPTPISLFHPQSCERLISASSTIQFQIRKLATAAAIEIDSSTDAEDELQNSNAKFQQAQNQKLMEERKHSELLKRQMKIETEAWEQAAKEYQNLVDEMCRKKLAPNLPYVKQLFLGWFEPLRDAILAEQEACKEIYAGNWNTHAPYFNLLQADKAAVITMHTVMAMLMGGDKEMGSGHATVREAALEVGQAFENEVRIQRLLGKKSGGNEGVEDGLSSRMKDELTKGKQKKYVKTVKDVPESESLRSDQKKAQVGSRLIHLLMETAFIQYPVDQLEGSPPDVRPAFVHKIMKQKSNRACGMIECDSLIRQGLERTSRYIVMPYMPMLVPPRKWTGYDKGAHLFLPSYAMRIFGARNQREAIKRTPTKQLKRVFDALDTLGSTKWRVNKMLLDVIERIWESGGDLADLVDRKDSPLPDEPTTKGEAECLMWRRHVKKVKDENRKRHAERCDIERKLTVARNLRNEEEFFYPHNVDFRGRAYPLHPYLNHLGSDMCRGILEFSEGKPLRSSGLRWLKIHLANLYAGGKDKLSFDDRVAFTEGHLEDIFDSADHPLDGRKWWLEAENPFQCLAACINLSESLRSSSPESTLSHLPVHQDGSCNGLQHYAALGRDKKGAAAVNLLGGEKPADVYLEIADRVLKIMQCDTAKDPKVEPNALSARKLIQLKQVNRKLVKTTVMTSVYGVTYRGAREQISRRLNETRAFEDDEEEFVASCYAAKVILSALGQTCDSARSIMSWLGDCGKIIGSENQPVRWVTPLGLPVVQPYNKYKKAAVKTSLQVINLQRETDEIIVKRQGTAFPPNFVHSLDGSHMMMTAVACKEAGLNFAGVHDSYWTHACDVEHMNVILREKFVELHREPILQNLLKTFQESFPNLRFPPLPEGGDFDVREVLSSPYFFN